MSDTTTTNQTGTNQEKERIEGYVVKNPHNGMFELNFDHTTGVIMERSIDDIGQWIRKHGGNMGGFGFHPRSGLKCRQAVFHNTKKLPKWAQLED